jgi:hypothetical protein
MTYVSIDIETTGLDPETCDVLEIGMVVDDTLHPEVPVEKLPSCRILVRPEDECYRGQPYALSMHPKLFREIAEGMKNDREGARIWHPEHVGAPVYDFLVTNNLPDVTPNYFRHVTAAGKNFANFDARFLRKLGISFRHRVLDPGSLYFNPVLDDKMPDFAECLRRAGLEPTVAHTAVEDAQDVIRLLRVAWTRGQENWLRNYDK